MRVAIFRIKERSWEINTMLPWKSSKKFSNHSIASTSKWLVGSSSNNTSGSHTNARANAALRNQPPESADNFVFGFKPNFNNTSLILFSNRQPSACSNLA